MTAGTRASGVGQGRNFIRCDQRPRVGKPRNYNKVKAKALIAAMSVGVMTVSSARAQTAPSPANEPSGSPVVLGEVVVTAEKHTATEHTTPISMAVDSGESLMDLGVSDLTYLAQGIPGVSLKSNGPGQTEFEMRGMTSSGGNSPTVGFYLDDIALTAP